MNSHSIRFLKDHVVLNAKTFSEVANMSPLPLRRQMLTAHRILKDLFCRNGSNVSGVLLADDVGLGKTTVGAIVAWVAAGAGEGMKVTILTPNPTIRQRWEEELRRVRPALKQVASHLEAEDQQIRSRATNLHKRHIHLSTHIRAVKRNQVKGDLIIVDEAHRSKHASSEFRKRVKLAAKASHLLFITATPMSIEMSEMADLLEMLGGVDVKNAVQSFGKTIEYLYDAKNLRTDDESTAELIDAADKATKQMASCVIRHSIEDLSASEQKAFGSGRIEWPIAVPSATAKELELLARVDRLLKLAHPRKRSNDPRFHVSRNQIKEELKNLPRLLEHRGLSAVAAPHIAALKKMKLLEREHPKITAVVEAISRRIKSGDKVVVFCHHHSVAAEMTRALDTKISYYHSFGIDSDLWRSVWTGIIKAIDLTNSPKKDLDGIREVFIDWLCTAAFRNQIGA